MLLKEAADLTPLTIGFLAALTVALSTAQLGPRLRDLLYRARHRA